MKKSAKNHETNIAFFFYFILFRFFVVFFFEKIKEKYFILFELFIVMCHGNKYHEMYIIQS